MTSTAISAGTLPLGTLVFEQFSGGKGRIVDTVAPGEMQAIVTDTGTAASISVIGEDPRRCKVPLRRPPYSARAKRAEPAP